MILAPAQQDVALYRAFMPRWAAEPLSGAGAALAGGRFNRVSQPALYLSFELTTAVSEYQQTSAFAPPLTLVTYRANLPPLVDLRRLHEGGWDPLWLDWSCDWRQLSIIASVEPPSWVLADLARELGHAGIIFPTQASPGGVNVVLFADVLPLDQLLTVVDPDGVLPRDGRSWAALLWRCTRTHCCGVGFPAAMLFSSCPCPHGARTANRSCGRGECTGVGSVPFEASAGSDRPAHALRLVLLAVCWRCLADAQRVRHIV